jgi:hypothetical protein
MPRKPAQRPWLAMGVSRSTWYRRGNRISGKFPNLKSNKLLNLPVAQACKLHDSKSNTVLDLFRAEAFVHQLQSELAEVERHHQVMTAIIGELASISFARPPAPRGL